MIQEPISNKKMSRNRGKKSKGNDVARLVAELNIIKRQLEKQKPEMKFVTTYASNWTVGQCNADAFGYRAYIISPDIAQGLTENTRVGASINWVQAQFQLQIFAQSATTAAIKLRFEFWRPPVSTGDAEAEVNSIYDTNPFISGGSGSIVDYYSCRNEDYMGQYKLVHREQVILGADAASVASGTQPQVLSHEINLRFQKPIKVFSEGTGTGGVTEGQMIMVVFANQGNRSTSTASTLATLPVTAANTGVAINYVHRNFFLDA